MLSILMDSLKSWAFQGIFHVVLQTRELSSDMTLHKSYYCTTCDSSLPLAHCATIQIRTLCNTSVHHWCSHVFYSKSFWNVRIHAYMLRATCKYFPSNILPTTTLNFNLPVSSLLLVCGRYESNWDMKFKHSWHMQIFSRRHACVRQHYYVHYHHRTIVTVTCYYLLLPQQ